MLSYILSKPKSNRPDLLTIQTDTLSIINICKIKAQRKLFYLFT